MMSMTAIQTSELDVYDAFHDHMELAAAVTRRDRRMAEAPAFAHIERDREPFLTVLEQQGH
jgi:DNA-binding GntR family transcriptional regulator